MLQEDSNGETGFEFVEPKTDELSASLETVSSMSSSPSLIPSPVAPPGNLLSNVPPPLELPSFISAAPVLPAQTDDRTKEPFYPTKFSPAIPASKGLQPGGEHPIVMAVEADPQPLPPVATTAGLFGWMKDAVSTGGILSKVAEKAKNSVDSMITTLDPQMREFIYSGGDVDILVASDKEVKISPIREAFQSVFGKATVSGISVQPTGVAAQPVGWASGVQAAEERIAAVYTAPQLQPLPVVAVEGFLVDLGVGVERWFELSILILSDPARQIHLQTFTQCTPVPTSVVAVLREDTPEGYPQRQSGFAVPVGGVMARNLQADRHNWHQAMSGVSRREILLASARQLAGLYKNALNQI